MADFPPGGSGFESGTRRTGTITELPASVGNAISRVFDIRDYGAKCDGATNDSAAAQAAHDAMPATGGILWVAGPSIWRNVSFSKTITIDGPPSAFVTTGDAVSRIFTSTYGGTGTFKLKIPIGEPVGTSSPARSYAVPLCEWQGWSGLIEIDTPLARIDNTGTLFRFNSTGNIKVNGHVSSGAYGVPFEFDDAFGAFQADTISLEAVVEGLYYAIFRNESGTFTVLFPQAKAVTSIHQTLLDHSLSADVAAGATSLPLQTGQGASWATGDSVYLEGDFATDGATRSGSTAEVVKVTGPPVGDSLPVTPTRFAHGTNSNAFTVQVLRGGVGLSLASNLKLISALSSHFENLSWAIIDYGVKGSRWDLCSYTTNRFIRMAGLGAYPDIGPTLPIARDGEMHVLDVPSWSAVASAAPASLPGFNLRGPWVTNAPTILWKGVTATLPRPWLAQQQDRLAALRAGTVTMVRESFDRRSARTTNQTATSGTLIGAVLPVLFGDSFTKVSFSLISSATLGTTADSHWYVAIYDASGTLIVQTADQTTTALTSGTSPSLSLQSTFTPLVDQLVTVALMVFVGTGGAPAAPAIAATVPITPLMTGLANQGVSGASALTTGVAPAAFGAVTKLANHPFFALLSN